MTDLLEHPEPVYSASPVGNAATGAPGTPSLGRAPIGTASPVGMAAVAPEYVPWLELRAAAEMFESATKYKTAMSNRIKAGAALPTDTVIVLRETMRQHHNAARLHAVRTFRQVVPQSIRLWQATTIGIGEPGLARLLGHIGHPAWKWQHCRYDGELVLAESSPRSFGELVAYVGLAPGRRRYKGMTYKEAMATGASERIGPILHSIADAAGVKKTASPYRPIYDDARTFYNSRESNIMKAHMRALRIVKREILRDLWTAAQAS